MRPRVRTCWFTASLIAIFTIASITSGLISEGFLEADGCTHYLYARFAFEYPVYLVDTWGRPFKTLWYAPAATLFGLHGVRVWSCVTALIVAWISYAIAKRTGLSRPQLAAIFLLGQPLFFMHSFSELTELPFAMLLAGAFLAYQSKRWRICAALAALMPLARPEGFGFILIFLILLITQKRLRETLILPIPFIIWNLAGWWLFGKNGNPLTWVFDHWPYSGDSVYQSGPFWHFALSLFVKVLGPPICLLMIAGVVVGIGNVIRRDTSTSSRIRLQSFLDHATQTRTLLIAFPLMILVGHSLLYSLGKMASSGEPRYMLIVAPFWAVLAAMGFEWIWRALRKVPQMDNVSMIVASIVAIAPTVIWQISYPTIPLKLDTDWIDSRTLANWFQSTDAHPHLLAAHPGIFFHLDQPTIAENVIEWRLTNINSAPAGTLLIWDKTYGISNASSEKSVALDEINIHQWKEITGSTPLSDQSVFRVFVKE